MIEIERVRLTDGSYNYNLRLADLNGGRIVYACQDEKTARRIACEVRDALNETLEPVGEWQIVED